jgi:flagellar motor switch protein FliN/FliY
VTLPVAVELGRARMQIQDILKLAPGSVIALDKSAGDPVELFINERPIAKGEVVIIDENFGVRLTSIVTATERIRTLR